MLKKVNFQFHELKMMMEKVFMTFMNIFSYFYRRQNTFESNNKKNRELQFKSFTHRTCSAKKAWQNVTDSVCLQNRILKLANQSKSKSTKLCVRCKTILFWCFFLPKLCQEMLNSVNFLALAGLKPLLFYNYPSFNLQ